MQLRTLRQFSAKLMASRGVVSGSAATQHTVPMPTQGVTQDVLGVTTTQGTVGALNHNPIPATPIYDLKSAYKEIQADTELRELLRCCERREI